MTRHTQREQLLAAINRSDWDTIAKLGWREFFRDLNDLWPKKLTAEQAIPYARVLGHHDGQQMHAILVALVEGGHAEWRPSAAQLAAKVATTGTNKVVVALRADQQPAALAAVRDLISTGHHACDCIGPKHYLIAAGVLHCTTCEGIDYGQIAEALETEEKAA